MRILILALTTCLFALPASAQYSGGSGTADDPYRIATAADLITLGETPNDYDKHFILTADIDLDPNLPGRKVFDRAVIAPDVNDVEYYFQGIPFSGIFDGSDHTISNLRIMGESYLGLFGQLDPGAIIKDLGLEAVDVHGRYGVACLVGANGRSGWVIEDGGLITNCHIKGTISGDNGIGGLAGINGGSISKCSSIVAVSGLTGIGGLVGSNGRNASVNASHSACTVTGDDHVGGLVGGNTGHVDDCSSAGWVAGNQSVGGLAGDNCISTYLGLAVGRIHTSHSRCIVGGEVQVGGLVGTNEGNIHESHSSGAVDGTSEVGGLVGRNTGGGIYESYSCGAVDGVSEVGGLVGSNHRGGPLCGYVALSYSTGNVSGKNGVGGLVGTNPGGCVTHCYSVGAVFGENDISGLVGEGGSAASSFWDIDTSGQATSTTGIGLTTTEMQTVSTFLEAGWDFVGETENGTEDIWKIVEGQTSPLLSWQKYGGGTGEPNDPYLIYTAEHLNALGADPNDYDKHFTLMADIDLSEYTYDRAVIAPDVNDYTPFKGVFDGNGHIIFNLTIEGGDCVGLFGFLDSGADVKDLGLVDVNIIGSDRVGGLAAVSHGGTVTNCYSNGVVSGNSTVGGLVGSNDGRIVMSYNTGAVRSTATATGWYSGEVGGLVCSNSGSILMSYSTSSVNGQGTTGGLVGFNDGDIGMSFSAGTVSSNSTATCSPFRYGDGVGGLAGINAGDISNSYSTSAVSASCITGGFVGHNWARGNIRSSYSKGKVSGERNVEIGNVGGFVGGNYACGIQMDSGIFPGGSIDLSFWDVETSGLTNMCGYPLCDDSFGKTTYQMQKASTFLEAGWDFVDETANGTEDIWWILEGQDYPRLWWEVDN